MKPRVSVIVPTYNRRDSLRVTLAGLAHQTLPADEYEIVVVSDGATDGTDELVLAQAERQRPGPRLLVQQNAGPSRARNRGAAAAAGEILVFMDDDVEPDPGCLEAHVRVHESENAALLIGPMLPDPRRRREEPPWIAWEHAMLQKYYRDRPVEQWSEVTEHHFYTGNGSLRREHFWAVGGFDERFRRQEDVELASRVVCRCGARVLFEPRARSVHRPIRTFESWLKIPRSYGSLDVQRAREGNIPWSRVQYGYHSRNRLTRVLADATLGSPAAVRAASAALAASSRAAYTLGLRGPALAALSALYNLHYLEGVQDALGTRGRVREILSAEDPARCVPGMATGAGRC